MRCGDSAATGPRSFPVGQLPPSSRGCSAPTLRSTSQTTATSTSCWRSSNVQGRIRSTPFTGTPKTSLATCANAASVPRRSRPRSSWRWLYEGQPAGFRSRPPATASRGPQRYPARLLLFPLSDYRKVHSRQRTQGIWTRVRRPSKARPTGDAALAEGPAGAQNGAAHVCVAGGGVAEAGQKQVQPRGEQDRRMDLEV